MNRHIKSGGKKRLFRAFTAAVGLLCFCLISSCGKEAADENFTQKCSLCVECKTISGNMNKFKSDKSEVLPKDGVILEKTDAGFNEGESVYDVFIREMRSRRIHTEAYTMPGTGDAYIEGINNIYEFDCGDGSGWLYSVNGVFQSMSCSAYKLEDGDEICFLYTCNGGADVGSTVSAGK